MIFECNDYRSYLKKLLAERIRRNPAYSLRALASQIGVSASMLSEVLKSHKRLSLARGAEIAQRLELEGDEERYFLALVQLDFAKSALAKEKALKRIQEISPDRREIRDLSVDHYHAVANWIAVSGMAMLESHPEGLACDEIARRLGISRFEVAEALDRWVRLELITVQGDIYRRSDSDHWMMDSQAPNGALRVFHRTMLEKAIQSLETQTNDEKFVGSETIAFDADQLQQVSKVIEDAIRKVRRIAKKSPKKKDVYHLGFQFFRVTKKGVRK